MMDDIGTLNNVYKLVLVRLLTHCFLEVGVDSFSFILIKFSGDCYV